MFYVFIKNEILFFLPSVNFVIIFSLNMSEKLLLAKYKIFLAVPKAGWNGNLGIDIVSLNLIWIKC